VIFILTGPVHSGKTTLLKNFNQQMRRKELKIDGFLSESQWKDQEILGYDLLDLTEEKSHPFIRRSGEKNWDKIGPFYFIPETLALAKKIIRRAQNADICVIDEVGPLELTGKGLWTELKKSLSRTPPHHLLVVRVSILEKFLSRINRKDVKVFDVQDKNTLDEMFKSLNFKQLRSRYS
jgi:nucleoside-triphosphatase THEP1